MKTKKTLFDIGEDIQALYDLLTETEGELEGDGSEEAIDSWFTELTKEQNTKIDSYCNLISHLEFTADKEAEKAEKFAKSSAKLRAKIKNLKERMLAYMAVHNLDKINTDIYTISATNNGGNPPLIIPESWEDHPEEAPEQFHDRVIKLNAKYLRECLLEGQQIEGCYIAPRGKHLRIR